MSSDDKALDVRCPAKLNLFLEVVRRRADGYHEIDTVMQAISLFDELEIAPRDDGELRLACSDPALPTDEGNLVVRAALALRERTGCALGATLRLTKRIPSEAGLAGGSSDAAGALVGLNEAWGTALGTEELAELAAAVGSDVAFFLTGGAARCTGRGEQVEPLGTTPRTHYVLVCPQVKVSTALAYGKLRFPLTPVDQVATMTVRSLVDGDIEGLGSSLFNRLEEPALALYPELLEAKRRLEATGLFAGVAMSGSGSALFGLCRPEGRQAAFAGAAELGLGETLAVEGVAHGVRTFAVH